MNSWDLSLIIIALVTLMIVFWKDNLIYYTLKARKAQNNSKVRRNSIKQWYFYILKIIHEDYYVYFVYLWKQQSLALIFYYILI